jgi:hypothetical protein
VLLMDGIENMKVPHFMPCHRTVTAGMKLVDIKQKCPHHEGIFAE